MEMTLVEAQERLEQLPEELERTGNKDVVTIIREGEPVLAVLPWDLYNMLTNVLTAMGKQRDE
jgi:hypothetical protein